MCDYIVTSMLHQLTTHSVQHLLDSLHKLLAKDVELDTIIEPLPEGGEDQDIDVSLLPPIKTPSVSDALTEKLALFSKKLLTCSLTHSLTHSITHSPTHPLNHSFTHPTNQPTNHPPTQTHSINHSLVYSLSLSLSLSHSITLILDPISHGGAHLTFSLEERPPYLNKTMMVSPGLAVSSPPLCY